MFQINYKTIEFSLIRLWETQSWTYKKVILVGK